MMQMIEMQSVSVYKLLLISFAHETLTMDTQMRQDSIRRNHILFLSDSKFSNHPGPNSSVGMPLCREW